MKTRFSKIGKYIAASLFFMALVLNVKFSLTDPFVSVGEELIAETTSGVFGPCQRAQWLPEYGYCDGIITLLGETTTYWCGNESGGTCVYGIAEVEYECEGWSHIVQNTCQMGYCPN